MDSDEQECNSFAIPESQKIPWLGYGIVWLDHEHFLGMIDAIQLFLAYTPVPRNSRACVEGTLLPRLREISKAIPATRRLGVELSTINRDDVLYCLNSQVIGKQLRDRGHDVDSMKRALASADIIAWKS